MPKALVFPLVVRSGSVAVRVYRVERPAERGRAPRVVYSVAWNAAGMNRVRQFADLDDARAEAKLKADALAAGRSEAAVAMSMDDVATIAQLRRISGKTPPLAAMEEWAAARALVGSEIIPACKAWKEKNAPRIDPVTVSEAVERFIAAKDSAGKEGGRTYRSKLNPLVTAFGTQLISLVSHSQLETYLSQFENGVTRNDYRKRAVALFKWAQKAGHLPRGIQTEIELTDRGQEESQRIGIITPSLYQRLLEFFRANHSEHLPALVLAGFCGVRADEIHGKRADRERRQLWEDIDLERGMLRVSVAKKGTAGYRPVPACASAVKWLLLCPERKGPVCEPIALETIRRLTHRAKDAHGKRLFPDLPENCFRHSFCTYRLALTGNVQQVAYEAGNSPALLRKHYLELASKETAEKWFAIEPGALAEVHKIGRETA